jgi:hypothetical protein
MPYELRQHTKRANVFRLHMTGSVRPIPPGQLSYKIAPENIMNLDTSTVNVVGDEEVWTKVSLDDVTKHRLLPITRKKPADWRLLFAMKRVSNNGTIWLKGAMMNVKTGRMTLLTSADTREAIVNIGTRAIKSHDATYHVGHYSMLAPLCFWSELKSILSSV